MAIATASRFDSDLDAQSPAADLVRVYLNGIGKTALLTAADEVELAKRIEAGPVRAALWTPRSGSATPASATWQPSSATVRRPAGTCWRRICAWWCRWPSATPVAACRCST